jgi:hypothetical protein
VDPQRPGQPVDLPGRRAALVLLEIVADRLADVVVGLEESR